MRGGEHERSLRDFSMKNGRIMIGEPLRGYRGVLTGVPERDRSGELTGRSILVSNGSSCWRRSARMRR